jgi:hypothetical protein
MEAAGTQAAVSLWFGMIGLTVHPLVPVTRWLGPLAEALAVPLASAGLPCWAGHLRPGFRDPLQIAPDVRRPFPLRAAFLAAPAHRRDAGDASHDGRADAERQPGSLPRSAQCRVDAGIDAVQPASAAGAGRPLARPGATRASGLMGRDRCAHSESGHPAGRPLRRTPPAKRTCDARSGR